jgi:predicted nucleic acid-binding protein
MTPTLLDTDTLTLWFKRHPQVELNAALYAERFGQLVISDLSYYEVTRGWKAVGATAQLARVEEFCRTHRIIPFTRAAAVLAGDIWADLKRRGLLIGEVDTLIAGIAMSEGLAVATRNTSHFGRVSGLSVVDWTV